jgi:hypothetical protein
MSTLSDARDIATVATALAQAGVTWHDVEHNGKRVRITVRFIDVPRLQGPLALRNASDSELWVYRDGRVQHERGTVPVFVQARRPVSHSCPVKGCDHGHPIEVEPESAPAEKQVA